MFWDNVAGVYDIFVKVINRKCHKELCAAVADCIDAGDEVLECACGTGMLTEHIAGRCKELTATDFSVKMLKKAKKNCKNYPNIRFQSADITKLEFPESSFDKVVAANVIHLLDDSKGALDGLARVCRTGGELIIPTYVNRQKTGEDSAFSKAVGKAGADFKKQFSFESYKAFFANAGYDRAEFKFIDGRIPCAVAIVKIDKRI